MRTVTRKPKRHCNECPKCLAEERAYSYCRRCRRWMGSLDELPVWGSAVHHNPNKKLGGTTAVYCNHPVEHGNLPGHKLVKLCGECHKDETENREVGLRER